MYCRKLPTDIEAELRAEDPTFDLNQDLARKHHKLPLGHLREVVGELHDQRIRR